MRRFNKRSLFSKRVEEVTPQTPLMKVSIVSDTHINAEAVDDESFPNLSGPPMFFYTARKKMADYVDFVNDQKPSVAIHLGDVITGNSYTDSFNVFNNEWNRIDPEIKRSISAGNHDYPWLGGPSLSHDIVAENLGYGDRPLTAGSKMNESFSLTENEITVRFINFETNIYTNGVFNSVGGYISQEMVGWITSEIESSTEDHVLLYAHKAGRYLEEDSRIRLETALSNVLTNNPNIKLTWVYGHSHTQQMRHEATDVGNIPMINLTALVDNISSPFYTFKFSKEGIESIDVHWVSWE